MTRTPNCPEDSPPVTKKWEYPCGHLEAPQFSDTQACRDSSSQSRETHSVKATVSETIQKVPYQVSVKWVFKVVGTVLCIHLQERVDDKLCCSKKKNVLMHVDARTLMEERNRKNERFPMACTHKK